MEFAGFRIVRTSAQSPRKRPSAIFWVCAGAVAFVAVLALINPLARLLDWGSLHGLTADQQATEIDSMRGNLIQYGGGVFLFGALVYTARTFGLSREGNVTDRYTKAIEQLGSAQEDVRLGAIYALERIMIDSARDHPTIVEVLAAFVRGHAPYRPPGDDEDQEPEIPQVRPPTDVVAAVTVLGRRPHGREERGEVNLQFTYLAFADLKGLDLSSVDLSNAFLVGAILGQADLSSAMLMKADLSGAYLVDANLTKANLLGATAHRAVLESANLTEASLIYADLSDAHMSKADLTGAYLVNASLNMANLENAVLNGAHLEGASLTNVNLRDATLAGADLTNADLGGTVLTDKQRTAAIGVYGPVQDPETSA
jgi:uncharacterized protein YjbI with pentapeptide repeats